MTTIAAIQGDGFALICADSRISDVYKDGNISQVGTLRESSSKIAINGKYLMGTAGDLRAINLLQHVFQPPTPTPHTKGKKLDGKLFVVEGKFIEEEGYEPPQGLFKPTVKVSSSSEDDETEESGMTFEVTNSRWKLSEDPDDRKDGL